MTGDEFVQVAFFWVGAVGLVIVLYRRPHTAKTLAIMLRGNDRAVFPRLLRHRSMTPLISRRISTH
jgi:hypothetical protein